MELTKVSKLWSKHNVPLDVWSEILSRLPVKSLLRFRCVSKSWRVLIEDPDFCYVHRNRFKNNTEEARLLFVEGDRSYGFIRCSETFETTGKLFNSDNSTYFEWSISSMIDGLVLINDNMGWGASLLWNPSIRKCRRLPLLIYLASTIMELGLGFDPLTRDHKAVFICVDEHFKRRVAVYSVAMKSWKKFPFEARGCSKPSWDAKANWWPEVFYYNSLSFKGCLYLISRTGKELVSFNLSNRLFTFANMPPPAYEKSPFFSRDLLVVVDGGSSLAVFRAPYIGGSSSLWTVESSNSDATSLCWTKRYSFNRSFPVLLYLNTSGDVLFRKGVTRRFRSFNVETHSKKLLPKTMCTGSVIEHVCSYKESLLLIHDRDVDAPTFDEMTERAIQGMDFNEDDGDTSSDDDDDDDEL